MLRKEKIEPSFASRSVTVLAWLIASVGLAGAVLAQGSGVLQSGTIKKVEIAVWTVPDNNEIGQLDGGDTHQLAAGEAVRFRLFVPRGQGPDNERHYLSGRWSLAAGSKVLEIVESDYGKGSVTVRALRDGTAELRYELDNAIKAPKRMARSAIKLRVTGYRGGGNNGGGHGGDGHGGDGHGGDGHGGDGHGGGVGVAHAEEVVSHLYQGILLREPDPTSERWVRIILNDGYDGVIDVAHEIAESQESQDKVSRERGFSNRDRLLAIYRHLLDLEEREIDKYQWKDHMAMLDDGELTAVVMDIVRSPEFRRVHGFNKGL